MKGESGEWGRAEGDEGRQEQKEGYNVGTDKKRGENEKEGKKVGLCQLNRLLEFHILHIKDRISFYYFLFTEYFLSDFSSRKPLLLIKGIIIIIHIIYVKYII